MRLLARLAAWTFYRIERLGARLPEGPLLLLANHPNALLDPALVWATAGRDIRFLAKSTLFRRHPLSLIVRASGAIPVYRRQDAGEDPSKNAEMFAAVQEALAQGDAVCIFPEGVSHSSGYLEPLRTGAARIALTAATAGIGVRIVTVGLNFDRKAVFRSRVDLCFGNPFACEDLAELHREDSARAVHLLTVRISDRLRSLLVEADPGSESRLVDRVDRLYACVRGGAEGAERVERRRIIASSIERLRASDPDRYAELFQRLTTYDSRLHRFGLRDGDIERKISPVEALRFTVREILFATLLVPLCAAGLALFWLPYRMTNIVVRPEKHALDLRATLKAVAGGLLQIAWIALLSVAVWLWTGGWPALVALFSLPPLAIVSLLAIERESAVAGAVRAYFAIRQTSATARWSLRRRRDDLVEVFDLVHRWLEEAQASALR